MGCLQITIRFNATAGSSKAGSAITSSAEIAGELSLAAAEAEVDVTTVEVVVECGDGACSAGEAAVKGKEPTATTCTDDCPFMIGECGAPPESDVGDPTRQCGGKGLCNPNTLRCDCFAGYAGDACEYCANGYGRDGQSCDVVVSALLENSDAIPFGPAPDETLTSTPQTPSPAVPDSDPGSPPVARGPSPAAVRSQAARHISVMHAQQCMCTDPIT
jgi:hypothetical protein